MGRGGNSQIPLERCLWHRAAASPFHSGPRKADVHRRLAPVPVALTAVPAKEKHLLVFATSALFVVFVYTLFPVCTQRGTAPDRADCFADHLIIQHGSFTVTLIVHCTICTDSELLAVSTASILAPRTKTPNRIFLSAAQSSASLFRCCTGGWHSPFHP